MNLSFTNQFKIAIPAFLVVFGLGKWNRWVKHFCNHGFEHGFHVVNESAVFQKVVVGISIIFFGSSFGESEFDIVGVFKTVDGGGYLFG